MSDGQPDEVLTQLKKMREGRGLSPEALQHSPAVLNALGTHDPLEAYRSLQQVIVDMPDSEQLRALVVDYGFNLDEFFDRSPSSREVDYLSDRRATYASIVGRDTKTLSRWSNRILKELRSHLQHDHFDGTIIVAAGVKDRRTIGVEVMRFEKNDTTLNHGTNTGHTNPEQQPSLPLILYTIPQSWNPTELQFAIQFLDNHQPEKAWALVADTIHDIGFGHRRTPLEIRDSMIRVRFEKPVTEQVYGVWWE